MKETYSAQDIWQLVEYGTGTLKQCEFVKLEDHQAVVAQRDELLKVLKDTNNHLYAAGAPLGSKMYFGLREYLVDAIAKVEQS